LTWHCTPGITGAAIAEVSAVITMAVPTGECHALHSELIVVASAVVK
jgi:hypothetical protein